MSGSTRSPPERHAIASKAAALVVALHNSPSAVEQAAIVDWIDASPDHAVAFAQADAAWDVAAGLQREPGDVAPLAGVTTSPLSRRYVAAGLVAATVAIGASIPFRQPRRQIFETMLGEQRTVRLADNSIVRLNTGSEIRVHLKAHKRSVRLERGEAMFDVAHDAARPFVVATPAGSIEAIGTAFNVRVRPDLVEVIVTGGAVDFSAKDGSGDRPAVRIAAGDGAVVRLGVVSATRLDPRTVRQRLAWRDGVIDLSGSTVEQAVEEFNRYRREPIVIGDPRISSIPVGGRYAVGDGDKFLIGLQRRFPIGIVAGSDRSVLLTYQG